MSHEKSKRIELGWSTFPISELLAPFEDGRTLHQGWSPRCEKEPSRSENEWGVLKTTSIQPAAFLPEHNKRLPDHLDPRPKIEVKPGDVLITCAGPRNRCGIACLVRATRRRLMMSGKMYRFRPDPLRIDPRYLEAYLQTGIAQAAIDEMKTGGNESGLNLTHDRFRKLLVPVAPFHQQKRIVAEIEKHFSRLDKAVSNLKRVKANLKRYKTSVLKAAVEGRLVETEAELACRERRSYETGAQLLQRILETRRSQWKGKGKYKEPAAPDTTDLPELPEGWVWASVGYLGDVIGGLTKNPKRAAHPMKLPYLRVANVYANELRLEEIEEIGVQKSELEKLLVLKDDLLIVEGNGSPEQIGRLAIWDGSISPCVHQNHLIKVRLPTECLPKWVVCWLMSPDGRTCIRNVSSSTSGLYTLSVGKVSGLLVPLPPLAEQQRIVAEVERRFSRTDVLEAQVNANFMRAEGLRQSILSRAFSGQPQLILCAAQEMEIHAHG